MSEDKGFIRLREPFPADQVGQLPKGGTMLDYVGHAAVTSRLLEVDPKWNWEPKAGWDDHGEPVFIRDDKGRPVRLWIDLTILGVTRSGVGTVAPGVFDAEKQLIGDALRNAAMRFGVALDLWIKGHEEEATADPEPEDPNKWYRDNGWRDQQHHDTHWTDLKLAAAGLVEFQDEIREVWKHSYSLPLTKQQADEWEAFLRDLKDSGAGDSGGDDPAPSPSEAVGPDAPLFAGQAS